jgi:hypothetical protein
MKKSTALWMVFGAWSATLDAQVCTTIPQGVLSYPSGHYLAGQTLQPGFDPFGYNYQAHLFLGSYANAYLGRDGLPPYTGDDASYLAAHPEAAAKWYWPYRSITVSMKWNDAWLSNKDCDGDGFWDRHYGFATYVGSGAWLTNHQSDMADGVHWTYFVKIVATPVAATIGPPVWPDTGEQTVYLNGKLMGKQIWGSFAIIQEVYNDPAAGAHGLLFKSPVNPGLGYYGTLQ